MEWFFATSPRGLEHVLREELATFGARDVQAVDGGVEFAGDDTLCYRANLESRVASRVLWRVAHDVYRDENDVYDAARSLRWFDWFGATSSIRVDVAAIRSPVKSLEYVTLRIKDAVCDAFRAARGTRPDVDTRAPDVRIHAFLGASEYTLYLDTSGEPLFKRGYRRQTGAAPIRENLAAGILRLAGWQPGTPLLDPMCGSGTFLCEAAMIAAARAPGLERTFAFQKLAMVDARRWGNTLEQARANVRSTTDLRIYGSDRFGEALKLARANLAALGFEQQVVLKQADVLEMPPPARAGVLVTNPPYGVRLREQEGLASLYPKLGDALKKKYAGWTAWLFTADMRLPKLIGLAPSRRIPLYNGALECRLYAFSIVAGSMRGKRPAD